MKSLRIGSVLGIPILISPSWLIPAGIVTWFLANEIYPDVYEEGTTTTHVVMAAISALLFFVSLILHELAHSVVALAYKVPVKSITLFLLGGVAQISREPKKASQEFWIAIVGPLSSAGLSVVFFGLWWLVGAGSDSPIQVIFAWLAGMNAVIAVFNLLPIFPMDGGRVFRSLIWMVSRNGSIATIIAAWTGRLAAWALIGAGVFGMLGYEFFIIQGPFDAVWFLLIGFFLETSTRQSLVQTRLVKALDAYQASDLMVADPPVVDIGRTVASLARGVFELNPRVCYFVESEGSLAGLVSAYQVRDVPELAWDQLTAGDVMVPRARLEATSRDTLLSEVLLAMENADLLHMPVVDEGTVVGVIGRDRIIALLRQSGLISQRTAGAAGG